MKERGDERLKREREKKKRYLGIKYNFYVQNGAIVQSQSYDGTVA